MTVTAGQRVRGLEAGHLGRGGAEVLDGASVWKAEPFGHHRLQVVWKTEGI